MSDTTGDVVDETVDTDTPAEAAPAEPEQYVPPTEAEWKAIQKEREENREKLKKANGQAAAHRKAADEAARKGETEADTRIREAREEAAKEYEARYKPKLIAKAIEGAATKAGFTGSAEYLVRLLGGPDAIELDADLEVVDLDSRIAELKKDLSGLFAKTAATRIDGADRPGSPARTPDEARRHKMLKEAGLA
jgi:hypothetical protein